MNALIVVRFYQEYLSDSEIFRKIYEIIHDNHIKNSKLIIL